MLHEQEVSRLQASSSDRQKAIEYFRERFNRRWFGKFEDALHLNLGPLWLRDPAVSKIVADALHYLDNSAYSLHAYCVMANHVHSLFTPFLTERSLTEVKRKNRPTFQSTDPTLASIMQSLKGYTARECNKALDRKGQFWEPESYDHEVRNATEFGNIKRYILNNPVKAGLVKDWRDWKWSWVRPSSGIL